MFILHWNGCLAFDRWQLTKNDKLSRAVEYLTTEKVAIVSALGELIILLAMSVPTATHDGLFKIYKKYPKTSVGNYK